jgi:hypothetical protein
MTDSRDGSGPFGGLRMRRTRGAVTGVLLVELR